MISRRSISVACATLLLSGLAQTWRLAPEVVACPFCSATQQTFSEEMRSMDAVVVARLVELPPPPDPEAGLTVPASPADVPKAKFEIQEIIKGKSLINTRTVETLYFGDGKKGDAFLIMAVDPPQLMWTTPLKLTKQGQQYVMNLLSLSDDPQERLVFFQNYLEDKDEMLARDAYDEFAKAPYAAVLKLKPHMKHDQLVAWIQDADIPASRRRLYLTMLGVCGQPEDRPMLEEMLRSNDRKAKSGLDALIACYLVLKGPEGMPLVEELYLKNKKAEYADTYAAIMALRFHGTESDAIPRQRLLQGLRHMLDRPALADLVIPDLARWEDWSQMERLVQLFKDADEKSSWVRVPVINYLRACPLPESKKYIAELEKVDPAAVKRANTFFPFGGSTDSNTNTNTETKTDSKEKSSAVPAPAAAPAPTEASKTDASKTDASKTDASKTDASKTDASKTDASKTDASKTDASKADAKQSASSNRAKAAQVASARVAPPVAKVAQPNKTAFLVVPFAMGMVLMLTMWTLLNGAGSRVR